jgi:hypothetical protein
MGGGCRGERRRPKIEEVGAVVGLVTAGGVVGALPQVRATVRDGGVVLEVADEDGGHHTEEELIGVEVVTWRNSSNGVVVRRMKGAHVPPNGSYKMGAWDFCFNRERNILVYSSA